MKGEKSMRFTKMHGLGNDYLYVYGQVPENVSEICKNSQKSCPTAISARVRTG